MNIQIHTVYQKGFKWHVKEGIRFKGYIKLNGRYWKGDQAIDLIEQNRGFGRLKAALQNWDGMFSIVIANEEDVIMAVDRMRTFPIFYKISDHRINVTDDPCEWMDNGLDENMADEFLLAGFTSGPGTLLRSVNQVEAGEVLVLRKGGKKKHFYYTQRVTRVSPGSVDDRGRQFKQLLYDSFENFVDSIRERPVALSLSGGYDSRIICYMLRHFGHENVLCFTYGRKGNEELGNSKATARKLGFDWTFIEYSQELARDYLSTGLFQSYIRFSGRLSSMPYLQDYFAVKYLKENQRVSDDTIFICGHSGDSVAGSHLKGMFKESDDGNKVVNAIFQRYYGLSRIKDRNRFHKLIEEQISPIGENLAYSVYEDWILKERQAKFVVNSAGVYDFFGFEYRMPLWDADLVAFFKNVPLECKDFMYLYHRVLEEIFEDQGILFENELQASKQEIFWQKIKDKIKSYLPPSVTRSLRKKSWDAYDILTAPMAKELKGTKYEKQCGVEYNSVICNWYLKQLEDSYTGKNVYPDSDKNPKVPL